MPVYEKALDIDIDGVVTFQRSEEWGSNDIIRDTKEMLQKWHDDGWYIVLRTGRSWADWQVTKDMLDDNDIYYDELVCAKPVALRTVYIDDKAINAICIERNRGLKCLDGQIK